jgi:DNA-binding transcriptional ArsR family regulator
MPKKLRKQVIAFIFASKYLHNMEARRDVFQAIADPTRRAIIGLIASEPTNVNRIAEKFDVSRQAISLHLKILTECGLVYVKRQGRERICEAKLEKLHEVNEWVKQYKEFWTKKLDALENYLNNISENKNDKYEKSTGKNNKRK